MSSLSANSKRVLVIVLVALAAIAAGGITGKVGHDYDERREADQMRSLGLGVRPSLLWTLDVKRLTDDRRNVLLYFPGSLDVSHAYRGAQDSPTHLIAAIGRPAAGDVSKGVAVGAVTLVGIDRADGSADWKRDIGYVKQCSSNPSSVVIACWSADRVIFVDTADGTVRSEVSIGAEVYFADVIDGAAYISGIDNRGTKQSAVVTAGSVDAPTARFRRSYPLAYNVGNVASIVPTRNFYTVSERIDGPVQYRTTVYDFDSGAKRFTVDGDVQPVGDGLFRSESYITGAKALLAGDGSTLAPLAPDSRNAFIESVPASATFVPVVLGSGAYDPRSGALLWSDTLLDEGSPKALVGNVMVMASPTHRTLVGLDVRSGRHLWETRWPSASFVRGGLTDGKKFVFGDYAGMHSIRASDGRVLWNVHLPRGVTSELTSVSAVGRDMLWGNARGEIAVWRARKGEDR